MSRRLNISPEVAAQLPPDQLAHLETYAEENENPCVFCDRPIYGQLAEVVLLRDGRFTLSALAHPACAPSGIYDFPGVATAFHHVAVQVATDGFENMLTSLGVRHVGSPQALLLLEPHTIFASAGHSGLEQYATRIGLAPIAAPSLREAAAPRAPNTHHLSVGADTVQIIHPEGVETAEADPTVLQRWVSAADAHDGQVLVILGRGLHLSCQASTEAGEFVAQLDEAIRTQPIRGAVMPIRFCRRDLYPGAALKPQHTRRRLLALGQPVTSRSTCSLANKLTQAGGQSSRRPPV